MMFDLRKTLFPVLVIGLAVPSASISQEIGQNAFMSNCAVCHGPDGKGNGSILDMLKAAPADLTLISARNDGRFPIKQVYEVIADPEQSRGHGTSEMPIWGNRFNAEIIAKEGEFGSGESGIPTAQARVLELVFFLATIQEGA